MQIIAPQRARTQLWSEVVESENTTVIT